MSQHTMSQHTMSQHTMSQHTMSQHTMSQHTMSQHTIFLQLWKDYVNLGDTAREMLAIFNKRYGSRVAIDYIEDFSYTDLTDGDILDAVNIHIVNCLSKIPMTLNIVDMSRETHAQRLEYIKKMVDELELATEMLRESLEQEIDTVKLPTPFDDPDYVECVSRLNYW
jgi:hypothetical protein